MINWLHFSELSIIVMITLTQAYINVNTARITLVAFSKLFHSTLFTHFQNIFLYVHVST